MSANPRQILAEADRLRRISEGARGIRASLRVGSAKAGRRGGVMGRLVSRRDVQQFEPFTSDMAAALDVALGMVASDFERQARETEAQVTTGGAK